MKYVMCLFWAYFLSTKNSISVKGICRQNLHVMACTLKHIFNASFFMIVQDLQELYSYEIALQFTFVKQNVFICILNIFNCITLFNSDFLTSYAIMTLRHSPIRQPVLSDMYQVWVFIIVNKHVNVKDTQFIK